MEWTRSTRQKPWYIEYQELTKAPISKAQLAFELQHIRHFGQLRDWSLIVSAVGGLIALLAAIFFGERIGFFRSAGVLFACLTTAIAIGAFFGFLFGIPRSAAAAKTLQSGEFLRRDDSSTHAGEAQNAAANVPRAPIASSAPRTAASHVNTNLEEISDWLTKLIIGAGLTQFGALLDYYVSVSKKIGGYGLGSSEHGAVVSAGLIAYGLIVGFLGGYLITRLFLSNLFHVADTNSRSSDFGVYADNLLRNVPLSEPAPTDKSSPDPSGLERRGLAPRPPPGSPEVPQEIAEEIRAVRIDDIKELDNLVKAARVHWDSSDLKSKENALRAYRLALAKDPSRALIRLEFARCLLSLERYQEAVDELLQVKRALEGTSTDQAMIPEVLRELVYAQLFLPKPGGYRAAAGVIEELRKIEGFKFDTDWTVKQIVILGQKLRHEYSTLDQGTRVALRNEIVEKLTEVLASDRGWLTYLQGLVEPQKRIETLDDDLEILRFDVEVRKLLELEAISPPA